MRNYIQLKHEIQLEIVSGVPFVGCYSSVLATD